MENKTAMQQMIEQINSIQDRHRASNEQTH
jgi:hypothetical protein